MTYYGKTDTGIVRSENQDNFGLEKIKLKCTGEELLLAVVCDGMGGANAGQLASRLALDSFMNYVTKQIEAFGEDISKPENIPFEKILRDGVKITNKAVFSKAVEKEEYKGMGTTLVAVLCAGNVLYTVNVGDSRMYSLSHDELCQITHDHSYVQSLVDNGSISAEEAKNHPEKNIILRAIGTTSNIEPDVFISESLPGAVLLCSDGLSNMVSDREICEILSSDANVEEMTDTLISTANDAGGRDNITAIVILLDK